MHRRMFCCANERSVLFKRTHFPLWVHLSRSVICSSLMVGHKCVELVAAQMHTHTSQSPVVIVAAADRELTGRQSRSRRGPSPQRASAARRHSPANVDRVRTSVPSGKKDLAKHTSPAASPAFLRIRDWNSSKSCAGRHCQPDYDKARGGETHELAVAVVIEEVEELLEIAAPHAPICTDVVSTAVRAAMQNGGRVTDRRPGAADGRPCRCDPPTASLALASPPSATP